MQDHRRKKVGDTSVNTLARIEARAWPVAILGQAKEILKETVK